MLCSLMQGKQLLTTLAKAVGSYLVACFLVVGLIFRACAEGDPHLLSLRTESNEKLSSSSCLSAVF